MRSGTGRKWAERSLPSTSVSWPANAGHPVEDTLGVAADAAAERNNRYETGHHLGGPHSRAVTIGAELKSVTLSILTLSRAPRLGCDRTGFRRLLPERRDLRQIGDVGVHPLQS